MADWSDAALTRAQSEADAALLVVQLLAQKLAPVPENTSLRLITQSEFDAASAWYTRCYVNLQEARATKAERAAAVQAVGVMLLGQSDLLAAGDEAQ